MIHLGALALPAVRMLALTSPRSSINCQMILDLRLDSGVRSRRWHARLLPRGNAGLGGGES